MCHLHNWLCLTSATARLSLTLVEATWVLEGLFLMSFPQDLSVLPHGECSLCKPSHPSQSSRTRDLWDPSLITELYIYRYIYRRGLHVVPLLKVYPVLELISVKNMAVNTSLGFTCRVSMGRLGLWVWVLSSEEQVRRQCCALFLARDKTCCCYSVPKITLFFCPTETEMKKLSLCCREERPCRLPRAVQKSHQLFLDKRDAEQL